MEGGNQHQHTQSTIELNADLLGELPSELLEQVLSYVPVPDLCRYRSVCKMWNSLILTPQFASLCVQNATKRKRECFVVKLRLCVDSTETGRRCQEISSWSIFDIDSKRWYNIVDDGSPKGYDYGMSAIDAGLVCTFRSPFTDEQRQTSPFHSGISPEPQILVVSNLVERRITVPPFPPLWDFNIGTARLELVVDDISHKYKVILICVRRPTERRNKCMYVYESATNQWRVPPNPPMDPNRYHKLSDDVCSAIHPGVLYVLFISSYGLVSQLYSYNFEEDKWKDTGVEFQQDFIVMIHFFDLVVSDNRLFIINQCVVRQPIDRYARFNPQMLDISEISFEDKDCKTTVQMTEAQMFENFDTQPNDRFSFHIGAVGLNKATLLIPRKAHAESESAKYMLYNLETDSWEYLPSNPVERLHFGSGNFSGGYSGSIWRDGKYMTRYLRLPNTPRVEDGRLLQLLTI